MTEMSKCTGSGEDWRGHRNKAGPSLVVYFAIERGDLVKRRLAAYRESEGHPDLPVQPKTAGRRRQPHYQPHGRGMRPAIVDTIAVEDDYGLPAVLAIIDTLAKGIQAGGGDNEKAKDKGQLSPICARSKTSSTCT